MADRIKGITVEIGGETTGLKKALQGVNKEISSTQSQLKDVERLLKLDPSNTTLLEQRQRLLSEAVDETSTKLEALKDAERQVQQQFQRGEVSREQYEALQREIIATEQQLDSLREAASRSNVTMQRIGQAALNVSEGATKVADATKPLTTAVLGLGAAVVSAVPATEEYRTAQGKLASAFEAAGFSAQAAQESYETFYKILGDADTATEASQLLAQLAEREEDVAKWGNIAAGIAGTFGDALPVESLIESANETARVGQVTGTLADALNWAGKVGEDEFNAMLADCSTESERNRLIMETLADTYSGAADAFWDNNAALVENREASSELQAQMAKLASSIQPVITSVTKLAAQILGWFNDLSTGQKTAIAALLAIVAAISPVATAVGTVSSAIAIFTGAATTGSTAAMGLAKIMTFLTGPAGIVVAAIAGITAAVVLLWNNCEGFRDAVKVAWAVIQEAFQAFLSWLQETFAPVWTTLITTFQTIFQTFQEALSVAWETITFLFQTFLTFLQEVFGVSWTDILTTLQTVFSLFGTAIQTVIQVITTVFQGLISFLSTVFLTAWQSHWTNIQNFFSAFKDSITGIINGIKAAFQGVIDFITGVFTGDWERAWQGVQDIFKGIFDALVDIVKIPLNGVIDMINKAIGFINTLISGINKTISVLNALGAGLPKIPTIPTIEYLAKGGVLEAGSAIVGEAGPELLSLVNGKARVTPLTEAGGSGGSIQDGGAAAGYQQTLNFYTAAMTPAEVARQTRNATRKMLAGVRG